MKKLTGILLALLLTLLCAGCMGTQNSLPRKLEVTLTDSTLEEHWDTHGGMSDGTEYWQVKLSPEDAQALEARAEKGEGWHPLPVSEDMRILLYGTESVEWTSDGQVISQGPYLTDDSTGEPLLPQVEEGYWFFCDDQTGSWETAGVLDRYSFNFTAAVYDRETQTLYCGELDT